MQAIAFNYLTALGLGLIVGVSESGSVPPVGLAPWVAAVVLGATFVGAFVLMARSTVRCGVTLTTVASRVSLVLPVVCSYLLFPEGDVPRWGAIATILLALVLMFAPTNKESKEERTAKRGRDAAVAMVLYPLGVWVLFGVNNFGLKVAQTTLIAPQESAMFSAVIFAFAALFGFGALLIRDGGRLRVEPKSALGGVALGVANFFVTWGMLRGLAEVPASLFFPLYHTTIVALVAVLGTVAFRERLSAVQWAGVAVAAVGIVMFFV
ncbi:MAG: EamA family transporter [Tidjanibacter sp.]|nr:EamA family transporter [Tidjanibacter sp.]